MNRTLWLASSTSLLLSVSPVKADIESFLWEPIKSAFSSLSRQIHHVEDQICKKEKRLSNRFSGAEKVTHSDASSIARDPSFSMEVGGHAALTMTYSPKQIGDRNAFTTASIPVKTWVDGRWVEQVDGEPYTHASKQVLLNATQSRLHLEAVKELKNATFKAYVEGDFWDSGKFRLRYAYGEFSHISIGSITGTVTVGQAVSAFTVDGSQVDTLDFQGPNSNGGDRRPLIKWHQQVSDRIAYKVGIEESQYSANAGQVKINYYVANTEVKVHDYESTFPMVTGAIILGDESTNIQFSVAYARLVAQMGFYASPKSKSLPQMPGIVFDAALNGYAVNVGGKVTLNPSNNLRYYGVYSDGLGPLIPDLDSDDANGVIGFDDHRLAALKSYGLMFGFEHFWTERVSTNLIWSAVNVKNTSKQPSYAYKKAYYGVANLIWTPVEAFMFGIEYQCGVRENKSNKNGRASRIELAAQFNF